MVNDACEDEEVTLETIEHRSGYPRCTCCMHAKVEADSLLVSSTITDG